MISNINILRHKIELTNFNEIVKSSERSIQAHMRKFVARTFQCNEKVLFHKPHRMVVVPNEIETIITQLQGGYCHVKYQEGGVSHIVSLHAPSSVSCTHIGAAGSTANAKRVEKSSFSADVLRDEIIKFASFQRHFHFTAKKSDSEHFNTTLMSEDNSSDVTLESILLTIHRTDLLHKDDPDMLIYFYCCFCDCSIVQ